MSFNLEEVICAYIFLEKNKTTETSVPESDWLKHEINCCIAHGCSFGDKDCPVVSAKVFQRTLCPKCTDEEMVSHLLFTIVKEYFLGLSVEENRKIIEGISTVSYIRIDEIEEKIKTLFSEEYA